MLLAVKPRSCTWDTARCHRKLAVLPPETTLFALPAAPFVMIAHIPNAPNATDNTQSTTRNPQPGTPNPQLSPLLHHDLLTS
jgi:hypothetical protein